MNSKEPKARWERLVTAARSARDDRDTTAPYGFATRVAALALAAGAHRPSVLERFALRAMGIACLLALCSVAVNYALITKSEATVAAETLGDDPMAELLDA